MQNPLNPVFGEEVVLTEDRRSRGQEATSADTPFLAKAPRWLFLFALVFAPWAYGATRPWTIQVLSILLSAVAGLWVLECALTCRRPQVPVTALVAGCFLLVQGWWMACNARLYFVASNETFWPRLSLNAPGSVDADASCSMMFLMTGLIGVFFFCCDLFQDPVWRKRVWMTMALTGASIAALGILQKIGGEPVLALMWEPEKRDLRNNFAGFRYRANAGAFLNVVMPLLAGLAFVNFQKRDRPWAKAAWLMVLFVVAAGIQLNPSRASWCIAVVLGALLAGKVLWHYWRRGGDALPPKMVLTYAAIFAGFLLIVGAICFHGGWETSWRRIGMQGLSPTNRSPTEIYMNMVPDAGAMGFGPGSFRAIFAEYQKEYDFGGREYPECWKTGLWEEAHQDYLQTVIEWGIVGAVGWAILVGGGLLRGTFQYFRLRAGLSSRWLLLCSVLAVGATLVHSFIDFPLQIASIQLYTCVLLAVCWSAKSVPSTAA